MNNARSLRVRPRSDLILDFIKLLTAAAETAETSFHLEPSLVSCYSCSARPRIPRLSHSYLLLPQSKDNHTDVCSYDVCSELRFEPDLVLLLANSYTKKVVPKRFYLEKLGKKTNKLEWSSTVPPPPGSRSEKSPFTFQREFVPS